MRDSKQEILHFWFEDTEPQLWFQINEAFDARVRDNYAVVYGMAAQGLCNAWSDDADGALALCIVLAQFPRRIYRGTARAYESDERALITAKRAVAVGYHQMMPHERRFFLYMPFEYSENDADQERNLALFRAMETENPLAYRTALRRYDVFTRFGRFPQRNAALGRESTPAEHEWLLQHPEER